MKRFSSFWGIAALVFMISCVDVPECATREELMLGGWRLVEVRIDGERDEENLNQYRLFLSDGGIYNRVQVTGLEDSGEWNLGNNQRFLIISPSGAPIEEYLVEEFSLRSMVLFVERNLGKVGPSEIRFFLVRE
jgi:hypothetical protein